MKRFLIFLNLIYLCKHHNSSLFFPFSWPLNSLAPWNFEPRNELEPYSTLQQADTLPKELWTVCILYIVFHRCRAVRGSTVAFFWPWKKHKVPPPSRNILKMLTSKKNIEHLENHKTENTGYRVWEFLACLCTYFLHFGQGFSHEKYKEQFSSRECLSDPSFANYTVEHIILLGTLFFPTVHKICRVFIEAEGGGPKPFTRLIKYGIDQ